LLRNVCKCYIPEGNNLQLTTQETRTKAQNAPVSKRIRDGSSSIQATRNLGALACAAIVTTQHDIGRERQTCSVHTINAHAREDVYIHSFITSVLDGDVLSDSRPGRFTSDEESPCPPHQGVGTTNSLDSLE
jgi:hypothetical protein